jgi:hypothetical protein
VGNDSRLPQSRVVRVDPEVYEKLLSWKHVLEYEHRRIFTFNEVIFVLLNRYVRGSK